MTGQEKIDTCKFRSKEKIQVQSAGCCGRTAVENYTCFLFVDLAGITPDICDKCVYYQAREENKING